VAAAPGAGEASGELVAVLGEIRDELRLARAALEQRPSGGQR
jgi:hypothetical protein